MERATLTGDLAGVAIRRAPGPSDAPAVHAPLASGVSPYFAAALQVVRRLNDQELIETGEGFDDEAAAEALVEAWTFGSDAARR
jgi:hypothetical protein